MLGKNLLFHVHGHFRLWGSEKETIFQCQTCSIFDHTHTHTRNLSPFDRVTFSKVFCIKCLCYNEMFKRLTFPFRSTKCLICIKKVFALAKIAETELEPTNINRLTLVTHKEQNLRPYCCGTAPPWRLLFTIYKRQKEANRHMRLPECVCVVLCVRRRAQTAPDGGETSNQWTLFPICHVSQSAQTLTRIQNEPTLPNTR